MPIPHDEINDLGTKLLVIVIRSTVLAIIKKHDMMLTKYSD